MRDLTCATCGHAMYRGPGSLPQGQAICHPCRRKANPNRYVSPPYVPELRFCRICSRAFESTRPNNVYCSAECRNSRRGFSNATKAATAEERGYGKEHRETRAKWKPIVESGQANCCICGYWIEPGSRWHLDHTPERDGYRGVAHASCNVRDGASRGARRSNLTRPKVEKRCPTCDTTFSTVYPKQAYCSVACRPSMARR